MVLESDLIQAREGRYALTGPLPPLAIPTTLQDSLAARLDRLATGKPLAQLCATLGREFSYALLQASVGLRRLDAAAFARPIGPRRVSSPARRGVGGRLHLQTCPDSGSRLSVAAQEQATAVSWTDCQGDCSIRFASEAEAHPEVVALHHTRAGDCDAAVTWWQKAGPVRFPPRLVRRGDRALLERAACAGIAAG